MIKVAVELPDLKDRDRIESALRLRFALVDVEEADVIVSDDTQSMGAHPAAPVLVLVDAGTNTSDLLRMGARGAISVNATEAQLHAAVEAIAAGLVVHETPLVEERMPERLTAREREVLQLLSEGLGNKEIAGRLGISDHTAKFHVASVMAKLRASTRTEAVTAGIRMGLIFV